MEHKIAMSLDDIIKSDRSKYKKTPRRSGAGNRRGRSAAGKKDQRQGGGSVKDSPHKSSSGGVLKPRGSGGMQKAKDLQTDGSNAWKRILHDVLKRAAPKTLHSAKLLMSNLDYGVSDSDIRQIFTEFGPLKKVAVHYDRSGRPLGTADVYFKRSLDALKAVTQYNGVTLDGRPMHIQFLTDSNSLTRPLASVSGPSPQIRRPENGGNRRDIDKLENVKRGNGHRRKGKGKANRNGGAEGAVVRKKSKAPAITAEQLDAELDAYVNKFNFLNLNSAGHGDLHT